jgi:hypothetical protein
MATRPGSRDEGETNLKHLTEHIGLYLLSALPGGTIILSLESGNLLHLDSAMTNVARAIARGASVADTIALASADLKVPRYVARERVRSLHLRLDGDAGVNEPERFGVRAASRLKVHHLGEKPAEQAELQVATVATQRGRLLLVGERAQSVTGVFRAVGERTSDHGPHFDTLGLHALGRQSVSWGPIDQVWFLKTGTSSLGFTLLALSHDVGFMHLMSSMHSEHNPREWLKLFEATTLLFAGAQAYAATLPERSADLEIAARAFSETSQLVDRIGRA